MQSSHVQSLFGVRILITRPDAENHLLSEKLHVLGAVTVELPTIEILPPVDSWFQDHYIQELSKYDWVIFTSVNGVRFFGIRLAALGKPEEGRREVKVAAIGSSTAAELKKLGEKVDYLPDEFLSEKIIQGLGDINGKRILLPRADIASPKLPELLRKHGAIVDEIVAYRTVIPDGLSWERVQRILNQGLDVVTFTSPSTVRNLAEVAGAHRLEESLKGVKVACIGPVTAEATKELGIHVDIVAQIHTIDGLVEAIVNEIRNV